MLDVSRELDERFELMAVDPVTWLETGSVSNVKSCTVTRDSESNTIESESLEVYGDLPEGYYRAYWVTVQDGVESREPVATFMAMCPTVKHDGKTEQRTINGYSPLMEADRSGPHAGWFVPEGYDIAQSAADAVRDHSRAQVDEPAQSRALEEAYVSDGTESWLEFAVNLLAKASMHFEVDPWGKVCCAPDYLGVPSTVHTYSETNSTVLLSGGLENTADWYDVPNVVRVVWSSGDKTKTAEAVNNDKNSPVSTVNRGYEVLQRESNPNELPDTPVQADLDLMAATLLEKASSVSREIRFEHPYDGGGLHDGTMIDFPSIGVRGPATVKWQAIKMETGCTVEEVDSIDERLWSR